jgi:hypothetical protein
VVNAAAVAYFWRAEMAMADGENKATRARYKYAERQYKIARDGLPSSSEEEPLRKKARTTKGKTRGKGKGKARAPDGEDEKSTNAA